MKTSTIAFILLAVSGLGIGFNIGFGMGERSIQKELAWVRELGGAWEKSSDRYKDQADTCLSEWNKFNQKANALREKK